MSRKPYRKHCAWCGQPTDQFVWEKRKVRRVRVYCHPEHVGNWELRKKLERQMVESCIDKIKTVLEKQSPWVDIIENSSYPKNLGTIRDSMPRK